MSSGFVYQGDVSHYRHDEVRGEPSGHLPPTAFVAFIQNHDQIGNRAFGERIADLAEFEAVKAMQAVLLLAPNIPLLFMGEEWGRPSRSASSPISTTSWPTRCARAGAASSGKFPEFASEAARAHIPDPNALSTFAASRLDWSVPEQPEHAAWLDYVRGLLRLRHETIVPRLGGVRGDAGEATLLGEQGLQVAWTLGDGAPRAGRQSRRSGEPGEGCGEVAGEVLFANDRTCWRSSRRPPAAVVGRCGSCARAS